MRATLFLPLLLALPAAAQVYAVPTAFCGGALVAEQFSTQVVPGAMGRADYSVVLRNTRDAPLRVLVQVTGDMMGKPSGTQAIAPGQRVTVPLGSSPNTPGRLPLRNEQLANAVRIGCQS